MRTVRASLLLPAAVAAAAIAAVSLPPAPAVLVVATLAAAAAALARRRDRLARAPSPLEGPPAEARSALDAVIGALHVPLLLLDNLPTVVAASAGAAELFDTTVEAMRGRSLIRATGDHHLLQLVRDASGDPVELAIGDGRVVRAAAHRVDVGPVRVVLAIEDRTALLAAQRARTDLVANVSHELRTPIAAALALAETLESGVPDEQRRVRFYSQLTAEIERLGTIVDRLLRLSRIEWADEVFTPEVLLPADLLETAADRIQPIVPTGQTITVDPSAAPPVFADRERALEVLANLIDNALRHSPANGRVTLSASVAGREVQFAVQDEGPGILPSDRERLFERFYTGDRARTTGRGGSGLGLAIARHIVSRHRGRIWVAVSERGALIRFTLPLAREAELRAASVDAAADADDQADPTEA